MRRLFTLMQLLESVLGPDHIEVGKAAECVAICLQQCGRLKVKMEVGEWGRGNESEDGVACCWQAGY